MPRGIPGSSPTHGGYRVLSKDDLRDKIKEIEARIQHMDRRDRAMTELKAFLTKHDLTHLDVLAMYRQLKPQRSDTAVKSKKSLQPVSQRSLKNARKRASGSYMVGEGKTYRGDIKSIRYLSPDGLYVWGGLGRYPSWFNDHLKKGGTLDDMVLPGRQPNANHVRDYAKAHSNGRAQA